MNGWVIKFTPAARRDFRQLSPGPKQAASEILQDLEEDGPTLVPAMRMRGLPDTWKARFFNDACRMVYRVAKGQKRILVERIRPRSTA
ncbi:MAG: type II toxin-antitoxin system RelE/ParE family toxin [Acidobacteriota bacterium]|nr:type II toxin-antitoxin system RelE/ParE family toxin [Acidobacteriota bacterium]